MDPVAVVAIMALVLLGIAIICNLNQIDFFDHQYLEKMASERKYLSKMAMKIIEQNDVWALASDIELLAAVIVYSDYVHGANLSRGMTVEETIEYLKEHRNLTEMAEKVAKAAAKHRS